jgi:hypothetical protein
MTVMTDEDWRALATQVADGHGPWRLPTMPPTRPEQMVALAAHAQLSEDETRQIRALGQELSEQEWQMTLTRARAERLATLVYAQLAAAGLLSVMPPEVYTAFAEDYRETLLANLRIRTTQEWLLDQLAANGIATIPLKGIVLVERLYGNPGWRPTRDIDMLVRRDDVDRIGAILGKHGYIPEAKQGHANAFGAISHTETKYTRDDSPMIELHWGLSKRPAYRRSLAEAAIWARADVETWRGRAIHVLAPSDELRYLAVHCTADHAISQLHWLVDIAEMVRKLPTDWHWDYFVAETITAGLATPVGLALAQCRAVLQLAAPEDALTEMLRAARAPAECAAWQSAWAAYLSRKWMSAHLRDIPSLRERTLFLVRAWIRRTAIAAHALQPPPTEG